MKQLLFEIIDVFTDGASLGNPAGLVRLSGSEPIPEEMMLQLGRELRGFVNETAFVYEKNDEFYLRFFSSECEVAFCGHALIGTFYRLITTEPHLRDKKNLTIHVQAGSLLVRNRVAEEDAVFIMAPQPQFLERSIEAEEIKDALGLSVYEPTDLLPEVIDGGLRTLICPMPTRASVLGMTPDEGMLLRFCLEKDIDIVHVFTDETSSADANYRTRVFAPRFGYLEDPATGSGNAAFAWYLEKRGLLPDKMNIEQGPSGNAPNHVKIKRIISDGQNQILFGGRADTRMTGTYYLR